MKKSDKKPDRVEYPSSDLTTKIAEPKV